ncbi:MAG: family 43 glycosylhydrolase, partial [Bacteroidales bacterium]|nr:family 43 glycosylhydrolase [Bacteroidales bacterium]
YKRNGYYYIFAPAGGVTPGWQTVLRSKEVFGPYEEKIVMHQGNTDINGPHQGGWVELESGEHWFIHFQCNHAYGRMLHLNPMVWQADGWPIIGIDKNGDGIGEPVRTYRYPNAGNPVQVEPLQTTDEFDGEGLSLQWRWQANYRDEWYSLTEKPGHLRLFSKPMDNDNLWTIPQVISRKFPAEEFEVTAKLLVNNLKDGDVAGIVVTGNDYATIRVFNNDGQRVVLYAERYKANEEGKLNLIETQPMTSEQLFLRMIVTSGATCSFSYSTDGLDYKVIGSGFQAKRLQWVGSSIGLYCFGSKLGVEGGSVDIEWFRIQYRHQNP